MRNTKKTAIICSLLAVFMWCAAAPSNASNAAESLSTEILLEDGDSFLKLMAEAYSPRDFAKGEVKDRDIERILTCGAKAPSAKNLQPWHFTVVKNYEKVSVLTGLAKEGNVLIIVSGNRENANMQFDCGLASQNMQLAAQALGLGARMLVHPVEEIEKNHRDALGIPQGYGVLTAILIGYVDTKIDAVSSASPRDTLAKKVNYVR